MSHLSYYLTLLRACTSIIIKSFNDYPSQHIGLSERGARHKRENAGFAQVSCIIKYAQKNCEEVMMLDLIGFADL